MQSSLECKKRLHVAMIMDGNGRWATARGLPRTAGHHAGVAALQRVCEAAPALGVTTLSLFAFSSDNWRRPRGEVSALMALLRRYLRTEIARLVETRTRLTVIGRRDRLPDGLASEIAAAEGRTASGEALHLRVALDYSARDAVLRAVTPASRELSSRARRWAGSSRVSMMPSIAMWICLSARAARRGCRIFCCGNARMRNSSSATGCGRTSEPRILRPR